jgi:hypothetical protein
VGRGVGLGRFVEEKNYHFLAAGKKSIVEEACNITF